MPVYTHGHVPVQTTLQQLIVDMKAANLSGAATLPTRVEGYVALRQTLKAVRDCLMANGAVGLPDSFVGHVVIGQVANICKAAFDSITDVGQAVALPAMSTANTAMVAGNIFDIASVAIPNSDWSIGGWFRPSVGETNRGRIFSIGDNPETLSVNVEYDPNNGLMRFYGKDSAGALLGAHAPSGNYDSAQGSVISNYPVQRGTDVFVVCQKVGNKAQIWLKFNGHAPVLAGEETFASFVGFSAQTFRFGRRIDGQSPTSGNYRDWFKLSYALTKEQIDRAANGTDPTTFATYAADDFYVPCDVNGTWVGRINGKNATKTTGTATITTGLGYAPMANAVFLNPVGPQGFVVQHINGSAVAPLSGTYHGADGGDIEVQFITENNVAFKGWTKVATGISGGVWSGSVTLPKGKRWIKVQMRKSTSPAEVMTSTLYWGVGENIIVSGQSLVDYLRNSGNPYGSSTKSWDAHVSTQSSIAVVKSGASSEVITISGAASNGGLIEITTSTTHGRKTGDKVTVGGIVGTTEANNKVWTITVTSPTKFTLNGSVFANAYTSGGSVYIGNHYWLVPANDSIYNKPDGNIILANAIATKQNCVVALINRGVSATSIQNHYSWTGNTGPYTLLAGHAAKRVAAFLWLHGNNNADDMTYFSDNFGNNTGPWTGWGLLGNLKDFVVNNGPNSDIKMGVAAYTHAGGQVGASAQTRHAFRFGMKDWVDRKIANGENCFFLGFFNDLEPMWESSSTIQSAHLPPMLKGQWSLAARLGHSAAWALGGEAYNAAGPRIFSAARTGAVIDLTVIHNGGSSLKVLTSGARPSGFEVSTSTSFGTKLAISDIQIIGPNTIRITLASDPGATCYVRYQFGKVGDYGVNVYGTPIITNIANNGAGLIRVTTDTSYANQRAGGHGLTTGQWVNIQGVYAPSVANGVWQVTVIDAYNFDLIGSSSSGMPAFNSTRDMWSSTGGSKPVVSVEIGVPIYDDRTIGGVDTNGAPLQPTFTYLTAA